MKRASLKYIKALLVLCGGVAKTSISRRAVSRERLELVEYLNKKAIGPRSLRRNHAGRSKSYRLILRLF